MSDDNKQEKPPALRAALARSAGTLDGGEAWSMPPGTEQDTTGEYNVVQTAPEAFSDEHTFFDQPGGEGPFQG